MKCLCIQICFTLLNLNLEHNLQLYWPCPVQVRLHPAEQRCGGVAGPVRVPVHAAHLQPGLLPRGDRGLLRLPRPRHQPRLHRRPHLVLRPASQGLMPYSAPNYSRY